MTVRFMLDTDTGLSAVTLSELLFGAARLKSARLNRYLLELTRDVAVMPFDDECAIQYARIANDLAATGRPIGAFDTMIAAHAMTLNLTLVTNNVRHFRRVQNLRVENWL